MSRTLWRFLDRMVLPSEHIEAKVMEFLRKGILVKRQTVNGQMQELVTTELNPNHPLVQQALPGYTNEAYANQPVEEEYEDDEYEEGEYEDEYEDEFEEDDNVGNIIPPAERGASPFRAR
jgi:hypothetical protein